MRAVVLPLSRYPLIASDPKFFLQLKARFGVTETALKNSLAAQSPVCYKHGTLS